MGILRRQKTAEPAKPPGSAAGEEVRVLLGKAGCCTVQHTADTAASGLSPVIPLRYWPRHAERNQELHRALEVVSISIQYIYKKGQDLKLYKSRNSC